MELYREQLVDVDSEMNAPAAALQKSFVKYTPGERWPSEWLWTLVAIFAFAALTRAKFFGNPIAHVDEEFYLYVGRAILDGQLPYVDVWDRKPIGLFLIYAGIASLGGGGIVQTHLVAGLFAGLTAFVISRIGNRITAFPGGLVAGIVYLLMLPGLSGGTGQSPVFYNLFMATAALLVVQSLQEPQIFFTRARATLAMLLVGVSISIKQTALFEGCWFGLAFLYIDMRKFSSLRHLLCTATLLLTVSLAPLALMYAVYAGLGHFHDIWQATFTSVLNKQPNDPDVSLRLALMLLIRISVLTACAIVAIWRIRRREFSLGMFFVGWLLASLLGSAAIPNFYDHYIVPTLVPLCAISSVTFITSRAGYLCMTIASAFPVALTHAPFIPVGFERAAQFDRLVGVVRKNLHGGCLYVYEGPTQLYTATGACALSRFVFPDHLNGESESKALPVSAEAEVERIFRQRPAVIVEGRRWMLQENLRTRRIMEREVACNYHLAATVKNWGWQFYQPLNVWVRNSVWRSCP